jgi:uncharacterized protein with GYD domain
MPTYIVLLRFTDRGIASVKEGPSRLDQAKETYRSVGAELKAFYLTTGRYDGVAIVEAPDDATQAKLALSLGARGNTRSETLRAFTEKEYRKIVSELP